MTMLRIDNIKIYEDLTEKELFNKVISKFKINNKDIISIDIVKKSIDARDKSKVHYNYAFNLKVLDESKYPTLKRIEEKELPKIEKRRNSEFRPIIVGSGPAGLFCALTLVDNGYKPIIIEQGESVEERTKIIEEFNSDKLNDLLD